MYIYVYIYICIYTYVYNVMNSIFVLTSCFSNEEV